MSRVRDVVRSEEFFMLSGYAILPTSPCVHQLNSVLVSFLGGFIK